MSRTPRTHLESQTFYSGSTFYVRPTYIVSVPQYVRTENNARPRNRKSLANLENNSSNGNISKKAEAKIRNAVNWLVHSAKDKRIFDRKTNKNFYFKVNFVTLTIPQAEKIPGDKFVKEKIFHPFIIYCRKYFGLRNYVWRAETQANGMLHFHLTTDTFLHHAKIRKVWNRLMEKEGLLDNFIDKFGHNNPNSTDVHAVKKIKDLGAYLAKYFCKEDKERRKVKGRLWGCNYELSHEKKCFVACDPDESAKEHRELMQPEIKFKEIRGKEDFLGRSNHLATIYFIKRKEWGKFRHRLIGEAYNNRRFEIRHNIITLPPEYYQIN